MRGRAVGAAGVWALVRRLFARLGRRPVEFVYPPAGEVAPATVHH
jgi:hypothetical protein